MKTIKTYEKHVAVICNLPASIHNSFQHEIENVIGELRNHSYTVRKLLATSFDIRSIYDDILKSHGQELMNNNGMRLTEIAQADSMETKFMASISNKTYEDSRTMRIATVIAMLYLPANLVMSFFSTTLVWFGNSGGTGQSSDDLVLRVHSQMWIAILTIVILATSTICISLWWD